MRKLGKVQAYVLAALSSGRVGRVFTIVEIQIELTKMGRHYRAHQINEACDSLIMRGLVDLPDLHRYCIDWQHSEIKQALESVQHLLTSNVNKENNND